MMPNIVVTPEILTQKNREEAVRLSELWEEYAERVNLLTDLIIKAGINPELLTDVVRATINLYVS
jgi:hypothetical protein